MKRSLYEWTAILSAMVGITCLGYWGASWFVSFPDDVMDVTFKGGNFRPTVSLVDGTLELCSNFPLTDVLLNPVSYFKNPFVVREIRNSALQYARLLDRGSSANALAIAIPGFAYRHSGVPLNTGPVFVWQVRVTMLIPGLVAMLVAAFSAWRFRLTVRSVAKPVDAQSKNNASANLPSSDLSSTAKST
ncbi:MAG TPA: hypothetical protein VGG64_21320 [Pirellulales bacterium]|jgi:hypothetical protein